MRVLLVTSDGACGIAEHSAYLKEAVEAADASIEIVLHTDLHPGSVAALKSPDLIWLNYHAALHSQWTPRDIQMFQQAEDGNRGVHPTKVGVTYHDSGVPNSDHCKSIHAVADAFVVHEPAGDLPGAIYWRQGIPDWSLAWKWPWPPTQPTVGTVGFPYAWKNYDLLCEAAKLAGWRVVIMAPGATTDDILRWERLSGNRAIVREGFLPREEVIARLTGCDATAFLYNTHNTGTSGAIRQGIAARKPVIASKFPAGRQFRDLQEDDLGLRVITWIEPNLDNVVEALSRVKIAPVDAGMVRLAHRDSWEGLGRKYAQLYRELVAR